MISTQKSRYSIKLFIDLLLINIFYLISAVAAQSPYMLLQRPRMFFLLFVLNVLWYFSSKLISFYDSLINQSSADQIQNLIKNTLLQVTASILFIFAAKEDLFTRNFILYYFCLLNFAVIVRILLFDAFEHSAHGQSKFNRRALIIGAGTTGREYQKFLEDHPNFGYQFIGFVDNDPAAAGYLGKFDNLEDVIKGNSIDDVIITLPYSEYHNLNSLISACERNAVRTHIIPDYFQFLSKKFLINMVGGFPIITLRSEPLAEVQWRIIKRLFDLAFALCLCVLLFSWLIPLISILVKLTSPGPVFFSQDRIGLKNEKFLCYKFRSMYIPSGKQSETFQPTMQNDLRVTKIGRFLRKSNLDELPQFWNVIKGDMSIVGPRPHAIHYNEEYLQYFDSIKLRNMVKPGITGWAQVQGFRGDVADPEENKLRTVKRIEADIWYIENWSFLLDIKIIFLTVWQMLTGNTKAY